MCRWLAYSGSPILLKEVLYGGPNSLVDQSLHSRLGAERSPPPASEGAAGLVESVASRHEVPHPCQGTVATTDGDSIWAFRYSSEHKSRSLFYTTDIPALRKLYPERQLFQDVSENARLIVSEPLGDVAGVWNEVPESSWAGVGPDPVASQA